MFVFWRDWSVILLSVFTVADLGILSLVYSFPIISRALTIASCSACLLGHLLWTVYLDWCTSLFWIKIATPAPTPCSLLLPSVKICIACSSFCSVILTESAGWSQYFGLLRGLSRGHDCSSWCCIVWPLLPPLSLLMLNQSRCRGLHWM